MRRLSPYVSWIFTKPMRVAGLALTLIAAPALAHDTGYGHQHQNRNDDQFAGAAIGAIAGGILGSQLAGNGARTEGSVLGAVIGGVTGAAIAGEQNHSRTYHHGGRTYHQPYYSQPYSGHGSYYARPRYVVSTPHYYSHPRLQYYHRPSVSISIGSGGYYGGGYYGGHYNYRGGRGGHYKRHHSYRRRGW